MFKFCQSFSVVAGLLMPIGLFAAIDPAKDDVTALSPDDRLRAVGSGDTISVFDVQTGKEIFRIKGHKAAITAIAFSPDGKLLASGSKDQTFRAWDAATGKALLSVDCGAEVASVVFSPDGKTVTVSDVKNVRVLDVATGKEISRMRVE